MATVFVNFLGIYFLIGFVFGVWFVVNGAGLMDEIAKGANWKLKLLWLPGALLLWPFLIGKIAKR